MNILEKICWAFVILMIGGLTLGALGFTFYILWDIHPAAAILTALFSVAMAYLTHDSKIMPK